MKQPQRWLILAVISSALFLIVVDMTVLYTALPTLTKELHASASQKLWIINAYTLVVSGLLLGMGTLSDRLGHKRLFIAGLAIFGIASLAAAFSPTPAWLIAARSLLAIGAAVMMPATLSIIRVTFNDEKERALAIGIWAAIASGGAALGPVVGGLLLEYFWWGSVFLINVPIVLIALLLGLNFIPNHPGNSTKKWDLWGSIQIMIGLIGIAYSIKELGKSTPSFSTAAIVLIIGLLFTFCFVRRQRHKPQPMIDFNIFRNPDFSTAVLAALVSTTALIGMELVFSQRLQLVLNFSPLQAGLFILPLPLAAFIAGPLTGYFLPRVGNQRMLFWALLLSGMGMGSYSLLYNADLGVQIACLLVLGCGLGATMTAASTTIMNSASQDQAGMAASIEEVSFELGGAIGVTLMGSILSVIYAINLIVPVDINVPTIVHDSLDEALLAAETLSAESGKKLSMLARAAFDKGFVAVLATAAILLFIAAITVRHKTNKF